MSTPVPVPPILAVSLPEPFAALAAAPNAVTVPAVLPVALAAGLATVHLFGHRLLFLDVVPRSRWLSLAGGSAVAYVFVHLLPELAHRGTAIEESGNVLVQFEQHVYLVALLGFTAFYGLEQFVRGAHGAGGRNGGGETRDEGDGGDDGDRHDDWGLGVFWLHIGSFALYNALIGYLLLHREETGIASLLTFAVAMGLHFLVNDYSLRDHHGRSYRRYARWVLASAVFLGLVVGYLAPVGELHVSVLFAFLAGSVVLNVIKEELPANRQSRFWSFTAGVVGYSALLLAV